MTCHLLAEDIDRAEQHLAGAGDGKLRLREEREERAVAAEEQGHV